MPDAPEATIDERIKAIAESLELLTLHSRENFDRIHGVMNALAEAQVQTEKAQARTEKAQARTEKAQSRTESAIASLLRIVESHERRLDGLEG